MTTEPEVLQKLGGNIKKIRQKKNMTQIELATECNFEKASMSRIESGQTNATILTLQKISKALEVPLGEFFKD
ncbi:helix-turn-helix domain-containing protein [Ferruginibacter albus]|uniref:helix-turn-helix domain-containing protein n=1 Tax=Ferruginibacter albus TaxID=2875540 RepID=UPI001CC4EF6F|nr:helix-turn-helix transcriptional regulator [Ferruginibacter albus]UAY50808.1 helix-turn-helix domain-containing protein [Ferruginibacter albus]